MRFYVLRFSQVRSPNISRESYHELVRFPSVRLSRVCHPNIQVSSSTALSSLFSSSSWSTFSPPSTDAQIPSSTFDLFSRRLNQRYSHQMFWRSRQANIRRQQSIHASQHICFHDHCRIIHHRPDELLHNRIPSRLMCKFEPL